MDMSGGEGKAEWYASINPNGRMPAIVHVKEDGTSVTVFESGACLLYMASEFDKEHKFSYPCAAPEYWKQLSWVGTVSKTYPQDPADITSRSSRGRSQDTALLRARQSSSVGMPPNQCRMPSGATRLSAAG